MSGRDIKGIELENKVKAIVNDALKATAFAPADSITIMNARAAISHGLSSLKTRGVIKGYRINMELIGTKITGDVTYSPIRRIDDVTVGLNLEADENYKRAMTGV